MVLCHGSIDGYFFFLIRTETNDEFYSWWHLSTLRRIVVFCQDGKYIGEQEIFLGVEKKKGHNRFGFYILSLRRTWKQLKPQDENSRVWRGMRFSLCRKILWVHKGFDRLRLFPKTDFKNEFLTTHGNCFIGCQGLKSPARGHNHFIRWYCINSWFFN